MKLENFAGPRPGQYYGTCDGTTRYYPDERAPASTRKRRAEDAGLPTLSSGAGLSVRPALEVSGSTGLALLEALEGGQVGGRRMELDEPKSVQRVLKSLVKKHNKNMEDRLKYAQTPEKFYDSEMELMVLIEGMKGGTESAALYEGLIGDASDGGEAVGVMMGLSQHENGDIAAGAIALLSDLTDADEGSAELNELKARLVTLFVHRGLLRVLLNALTGSLDESHSDDETAAVYNVLSIFENLVDLNPEELFGEMEQNGKGAGGAGGARGAPEDGMAGDLMGIVGWLTARVARKKVKGAELDSNTQYASEILSVILQSSGSYIRRRFVMELQGVDAALRSLAPYRSAPPATPEEAEFVENMFDVLCAVLMEDAAKSALLGNEGVELMVLFLKGRTVARTAALKCLDFATTRCAPAAAVCIDKGLLALLFPIFMGKLKVVGEDKKKVRRHIEANKEEEEVRCVSIVSNLFVGIGSSPTAKQPQDGAVALQSAYRERLVAKFAEKDGEKSRRLIEVMVVFAGRVASEEARILRIFDGDGDQMKDEVLLAKMDAGLFTVQQCALVLAELWASEDFSLRRAILTMLHEHELTLKYLETTLEAYVDTLGEDDTSGNKDLKQHIERVRLLMRRFAPDA